MGERVLKEENIEEQRKIILIKQGYVESWGKDRGTDKWLPWKTVGDTSFQAKEKKVVVMRE